MSTIDKKGLGLNVTVGIFVFLAWVACCVSFGGVLLTGRAGEGTANFYYNKVTFGGATHSYSSLGSSAFDKCHKNGKGLVGMMALAFILLTIEMALIVIRWTHRQSTIAFLGTPEKGLGIELIVTGVATFLVFVGILCFGAGCFTPLKDMGDGDIKMFSSIKPTGFVLVILSLMFLLGVLAFLFVARKDSSLWGLRGKNDDVYTPIGGGATQPTYGDIGSDSTPYSQTTGAEVV